MTDDNLQVNQNMSNVSAPATPVPSTAPDIGDDYLDLDSIYDLDVDSMKTQATLSANAPVPAASLESFRAQSGAAIADGAVDNKVLADLQAKAGLSAVPVKPVVSSVSPPNVSTIDDKDDEMFDIDALKKISQEVKKQSTPVVPTANLVEQQEIEEVNLVDLVEEKSALPEVKPVDLSVKPVSEAVQIEKDLEANTIDLDAELKEGELSDLFDGSSITSAELTESVGGAPKLNKVQITKTMSGTERPKVIPQKLMKTDSIYHRSNKKDLNLSAAISDKKLKSPVEELAELTLLDWSRLGDIPSERAAKIKEKIVSLGAKSIIDEVNGLNAWRNSQTHQVYLDLGIAAMLSDKSLEETIAEQKDLSMEEWFTINQLNRELMI